MSRKGLLPKELDPRRPGGGGGDLPPGEVVRLDLRGAIVLESAAINRVVGRDGYALELIGRTRNGQEAALLVLLSPETRDALRGVLADG